MPTTWTLTDVVKAIGRGWLTLLSVLIIAAIGTGAAYTYFPHHYTATAVHTVEPISALSAGSSFNTVNMQTEQVVATSLAVMEVAADSLGGDIDVRDLADATTVQVPRNSQILQFEVSTDDAQQSADWANAIATAYGTQRTATAQEVVERTTSALTSTIEDLRSELQDLEPDSPDAAAISLQLEAAIVEEAKLTSTPFFAGTLITPAIAPLSSNRPSLLIFVAGGAAFGLLLGTILAAMVGTGKRRASQSQSEPTGTDQPEPAATPAAEPSTDETPASDSSEDDHASEPSTGPDETVAAAIEPTAATEPTDPAQATGAQALVRPGRGLPARMRQRGLTPSTHRSSKR